MPIQDSSQAEHIAEASRSGAAISDESQHGAEKVTLHNILRYREISSVASGSASPVLNNYMGWVAENKAL
jgi:hypothetical protein